MNIVKWNISLVILLKCVIASESGVKEDVIEALSESEKERGFMSIKRDWGKWRERKDLFDYVVTRSVEFIIGFIDKVWDVNGHTLAALFLKKPDMVDEVLKKINYNDHDLINLT